jgi:hypothetical protein
VFEGHSVVLDGGVGSAASKFEFESGHSSRIDIERNLGFFGVLRERREKVKGGKKKRRRNKKTRQTKNEKKRKRGI